MAIANGIREGPYVAEGAEEDELLRKVNSIRTD